jgi:hypothetical protein
MTSTRAEKILYLRGTFLGKRLKAILEAIPEDGRGYGSYALARKLGCHPQTMSNMLADIFEISRLSEGYDVTKNTHGTITIRKKLKRKRISQDEDKTGKKGETGADPSGASVEPPPLLA